LEEYNCYIYGEHPMTCVNANTYIYDAHSFVIVIFVDVYWYSIGDEMTIL